MAQHDFNIANASGATVRADLNNALTAIQTTSIGSSAPSSVAAGQIWIDNSGSPWVVKVYDGAQHIAIANIDTSNNLAYAKTAGITDNATANAITIGADLSVTFSKVIIPAIHTETTSGTSLTLNFDNDNIFVITLGHSITLANPTTENVGQSGVIVFIQDGTGSRTCSLASDYESVGGSGITLSSAAAAVDICPYYVYAAGRILIGTPQLAFS